MKKFTKFMTLVMGVSLAIMPVHALAADTNKEAVAAVESKSFKDVPEAHWAYSYIMEGVEKGYISGDPSGNFRPNDPVSVAEFITMLFKSMTDIESQGYTWWSDKYTNDLPYASIYTLNTGTSSFAIGSPWYANYVKTAKGIDVIRDEYDGKFDQKLTREKAAKIINSFDAIFNGAFDYNFTIYVGNQLFKDYEKVDPSFKEAVSGVELRGIMNGNEKGNFNPKATISRAEVAKICSFVADKSLRILPELNLTDAPISMVSTNFGEIANLFYSQEAKTIYDTLRSKLNEYPGATLEATGGLSYFPNEELRDEAVRAFNYFDVESMAKPTMDGRFEFGDGHFGIKISTEKEKFERFSSPLKEALSLVFKTNATDVYNLISKQLSPQSAMVKKTIEGREIIISNSVEYLNVGIYG